MQPRIRISTALLISLVLGTAGTALADLVLTTDKPTYAAGEIVHMTVRNAGSTEEHFLSYPYFVIWNQDTNECVTGCVGLPVVTPFPAGEVVSMDWDTGSVPDVPGNYIVGVAVTNGPTTSYVLTMKVAAEQDTWSSLKSMYR